MSDMPTWIQYLAAVCGVALVIQRLGPQAFRIYEARRVTRNRALLAKAGLTREQYMATIGPTNYQDYAEAVMQFWPRRDRHERRDAMFDRVGKDLGPLAAAEIRAAKEVADRLAGR